MSTVDDILDVIDAGLQSSDDWGYGTDHNPDACARCQCHDPVEGGDLCHACRSFLLGDTEEDPAHRYDSGTVVSSWFDEVDWSTVNEAFRNFGERLADAAAAWSSAWSRVMDSFVRTDLSSLTWTDCWSTPQPFEGWGPQEERTLSGHTNAAAEAMDITRTVFAFTPDDIRDQCADVIPDPKPTGRLATAMRQDE